MLEQGAAPNAGDEENGTSLTVAAAWGYPLVVEALISAGDNQAALSQPNVNPVLIQIQRVIVSFL